ncbi:MAG: 50S ribosomal protein L30 [Bacillota bacterium]
MAKVKVTLLKSLIGRSRNQRTVVRTLGLKKPGNSVIHNDTPQIRGMIAKVSHLLKVEEI